MKKNFIYTLVAATLLSVATSVTSCGGGSQQSKEGNGDELSGEISLSGAFALYPLAVKWGEEFQKLHPNVKIDISAGGAGKGITDALAQTHPGGRNPPVDYAGCEDLGTVNRHRRQDTGECI